MKLVFTNQAIESLNETLTFLKRQGLSLARREKIRDGIFEKARELLSKPYLGQEESQLSHLNLAHRRVIKGHSKIIYRVVGDTIYVTDVFDSRQDPRKMKS